MALVPPTQTIDRLSRAQVRRYARMQVLAEEKSALSARTAAIDEEYKALKEEMVQTFGPRDFMRVSSRKILARKLVERDAYVCPATSYYIFKEVQG